MEPATLDLLSLSLSLPVIPVTVLVRFRRITKYPFTCLYTAVIQSSHLELNESV